MYVYRVLGSGWSPFFLSSAMLRVDEDYWVKISTFYVKIKKNAFLSTFFKKMQQKKFFVEN